MFHPQTLTSRGLQTEHGLTKRCIPVIVRVEHGLGVVEHTFEFMEHGFIVCCNPVMVGVEHGFKSGTWFV